MCTLASQSGNENIDLLLSSKMDSDLKFLLLPGVTLVAIFSKRSKQKRAYVSLDDFQKLKVIGQGGFAEKVYLARKKDSGENVVIKTMCKKFILDEMGRYEQVFGELKVMELLLDSPFVIKLFFAFQSEDHLHFVMDFCSGGELFYLLQRQGRFTEA